jgi:hypothetical protein
MGVASRSTADSPAADWLRSIRRRAQRAGSGLQLRKISDCGKTPQEIHLDSVGPEKTLQPRLFQQLPHLVT